MIMNEVKDDAKRMNENIKKRGIEKWKCRCFKIGEIGEPREEP